MATVSSLGIGSGVDLNSLLSKLVAAESTPITQLNTKQTSYKSQLSAYGRIKSAMEKLATAAENIGSETKFKGFTATVADTGYASATATSFAAKGTFDLRVEQLAQANKLQSGINPTVSAGTLQIELGDISGGSFVAKGGYTPVTVNFTGSTLEDLRSAINDADAGVTATIVNGTNGKQLVLTSNETGVENTVRLTGTGGLSGLTYNPLAPSAAFTEKSAAQDAEAYLDGVLVSSSTNTISEAMTGVSITLKKAHDPLTPTDQTTLTIGADSEGMSTRAKDFTTAWNELNSLFKELTKFDTTNNKASTLTGDASVGGMGRQLRDILFSSPAAASTELPRLSDLGITLGADGSLSLDATDFENAVASNLTAVTATITAFGASFQTTAENFLDTDGIITTRQDSLNTIIANLDDRREELQRRVDAIEARYRAQFTALDTLMSRMQTQSTYLTQQLAALSG